MYDKLTCRIKDKIEIEKHYSGRYGAPGQKRQKKRQRTPEEVAKQNHWNRCKELRRTMELNFEEGDWHVTLTCRKEDRPDPEKAQKLIRYFRDKLRKAYRQQGWELKYIITCETGERGAVHWHMVVNNMHNDACDTAKLIRSLWQQGRVYFSPLDSGGYQNLAEYMVKETSKRIEEKNTIEKLSYMISRNLIRPEVQREKVPAKSWTREPKVPQGWYLVKDSLINGINKYTGWPYQRYTIRRLPGKETDEDSGHIHRHKHKGS